MSNQFANLDSRPAKQDQNERLAILLQNAVYDALDKQIVRVSAWSICCGLWLYTVTSIPVIIILTLAIGWLNH